MFLTTLEDKWVWPESESKRINWWRFRQWAPRMHEVNGSACSKTPSATDKGPEDRTANSGDTPTRTDQGSHLKEANLPKHYKD